MIFDETLGNDNFPLAEIHSFSDDIILNLKVIFFRECEVKIVANTLLKRSVDDKEWNLICPVSELDTQSLDFFRRGLSVSKIVNNNNGGTNCTDKDQIEQVKSFLFVLIDNRICYPDIEHDFNLDIVYKSHDTELHKA
jgi:hypothetical protein